MVVMCIWTVQLAQFKKENPFPPQIFAEEQTFECRQSIFLFFKLPTDFASPLRWSRERVENAPFFFTYAKEKIVFVGET